MDRFYEDESSLFVEAYDAFYRAGLPQYAGDVEFYADLGRRTGGAVLELACGTGRVTLPLAETGLEITGLDSSQGMLSMARRKAAALPVAARRRLTLVHQDMTRLDLDRQFGLIFIPFRSFQHILTIDLQKQVLGALRRHLAPGGRAALHLFDPRLDLLIDETLRPPGVAGTSESSGRRYSAEVARTRFDHTAQIRRDLWRYQEFGPDGQSLREETREMALRWTYRWELHHLLALCDLSVEAEYSDFKGSPPAYGKELVLVAKADR